VHKKVIEEILFLPVYFTFMQTATGPVIIGRKIRIGMGQMLVIPGRVSENLARANNLILQASACGCHVIVLPECMDAGWTCARAPDLACPIPGATSASLCRAAARAGMFVVAGITELRDHRVYNAAVLIAPDGSILTVHRKINELDVARPLYSTGKTLHVADTSIGRIGLAICADLFPESLALGEAQARMGAEMILSPCSWAVDADHDNTAEPYGTLWMESYTRLASKYPLVVVGVSNVGRLVDGPWKGRKCVGCSLAVGQGGSVLAQGPYGCQAERLLSVDVCTGSVADETLICPG
jgi:predicted amidohydrolase